MQFHLDEIAAKVIADAHAVLVLDQGRLARRQRPQGSSQSLAYAAAAACTSTQPAGKYLAVHAAELADEPNLQIL
jgi:hypothetical protein